MPSGSEAVLQFLEHDTFADSEYASLSVDAKALPELATSITRIRDDVKAEIRTLSREAAPDIDSWIKQAKQLQADLDQSRETAREIVQQAQAGEALRAQEDDAAAKGRLLQEELAFNETLTGTLEHLQIIYGLLDSAQEATIQKDALLSLEKLRTAGDGLKQLDGFTNTRFASILQQRAAKLKASVTEDVVASWNSLVHVDSASSSISIKTETTNKSTADLDTVVQALTQLGLFDRHIHRLAQDFNQLILAPRLIISKRNTVAAVAIQESSINTAKASSDLSTTATIKDIHKVLDYLVKILPVSVASPLSSILIPLLLPQLQERWLETSIPASLEGLDHLEDIIESVNDLAEYLHNQKWTGAEELLAWIDDIPRLWLAKRKAASLAEVRESCFRSTNQKKQAERVETQTVSDSDILAGGQSTESNGVVGQHDDDWDAGWEEPEQNNAKPGSEPVKSDDTVDDDDDAAAAWGGFDEDDTNEDQPVDEATHTKAVTDQPKDETADEEWGAWGDDEVATVEEQASSEVSAKREASRPPVNGKPSKQARPAQREITLRETYTVTSLPDALLELIEQILNDAEALAGPHFADSKVRPAANGLYSVPTLVLAMFRATASTYYSKDVAGNMLIYNDCTRLSDQLRDLAGRNPTSRLRVDSDLKVLDSLRKRAYGKEMESQRTILGDLLDGAQGFVNCSVAPFAAECENAVLMTVDRIREVEKQWNGILSRSALLQSIGQLLSTVVTKICIDIQDMSDISESDSHRLRQFCDQVAELKALFSEEGKDMTGVYTPQWFKFLYLSEILESSLADIKFLWTEGELRLEFEADEVVDLIEALFAESEHRRKAIAEIKRSAGL